MSRKSGRRGPALGAGAALVLGAAGVIVAAAPPALAADRIVVHPGQSVQAAVDAAPTGGTVVLAPGNYAENIWITRPVTLRGEPGARFVRAAEPGDTPCNGDQEAADAGIEMQVAVCVTGRLGDPKPGDGDLPSVLAPVRGVRIEGVAFDDLDEAVLSVGTRDLQVQNVSVTRARDTGIMSWYATNTSMRHVQVSGGTGFAAISVRRSAGVSITDNVLTGNAGFGVALADDTGALVSNNRIDGNAGGLVAWDSGDLLRTGDLRRLRVTGNHVAGNTRVFGDGEGPSFGHVGIALAGATHSVVAGNTIRDNGAAVDGVFLSGSGVALLDGDLFGGGTAAHDRIVGNQISGSPVPVDDEATGPGNVVHGNIRAARR